MEELRSTDVLDREILADAKKKAEKILSRADDVCLELLGGVGARLDEAKKKAKSESDSALDLFTKNISASLPLERERYLVSYIHGSVVDAINSYFENAGEERQLQVIEGLLKRSVDALGSEPLEVSAVGIDKSTAASILSRNVSNTVESIIVSDEVVLADEAVDGFKFRKGLFVSTVDGKVTCRLTLDQKVREILDSHSYELASSLFAGRIPE